METETKTRHLTAVTFADVQAAMDRFPGRREATPAEVLEASPTNTLLDALVQLTHRVHNLTATLDGGTLTAAERKPLRESQRNLREQRELIRAEVLRRAGA